MSHTTAKPVLAFIAFRINAGTHERMHAYKRATGMPLQMQVNRALDEWLAARGFEPAQGFERPAYPDLPGGTHHSQQFGKTRKG